MKTIAFTTEEEKELLNILPQKYHDRIKNSVDILFETSQNFLWKSIFESLPEKLDIGRRIKVKSGTYLGRMGVIANHYVNMDDCSGYYGKVLYLIGCDTTRDKIHTNDFIVYPKDCEFID